MENPYLVFLVAILSGLCGGVMAAFVAYDLKNRPVMLRASMAALTGFVAAAVLFLTLFIDEIYP